MADVRFITWQVDGHNVCAKVISVKDNVITAMLPSRQTVDIDESLVSDVDADTYNNSIKELIDYITSEHNYFGEKIMSDVSALESRIAELNDSLSKSQADLVSANESNATLTAQMSELQEKLATIERANKAQSRVAELREINDQISVNDILNSESDDKSLEMLGNMDDAVYSAIVSTARKLTEMTITNLPKSTDQSVTNLTQSTDASAVLETAVEDTTDNADLAVAGITNTDKDISEFTNAVAKYLTNK